MLDGSYSVTCSGFGDSVVALTLREGFLSGMSSTGIKWDGSYHPTENADLIEMTINFSVPPGTVSITTGFATEHKRIVTRIFLLPADLGAGKMVHVDIPEGAGMDLVFKRI